jgi:hypothetical protein
MAQWADFPFKDPLFTNADESILRAAPAAVENAYSNRAGGFTRTPGLVAFASLPSQGRCYLYRFRQHLHVVTERGRTYRLAEDGTPEDVTGVVLTGGKRPIFAATDDNRLVMAAGGPLVQLRSSRTELLSDQAPESTHVAFVDGYLIAPEIGSGRFRYCNPGEYGVWDDLSVFSAEGKPDDLNGAIVTPYRELLLTGEESIEQFERLQSGTRPFFRRWSTGEGLAHPYTLVADVAGTYGVNLRSEFVRFSAQVSREMSADVALTLEEVDDWTDAWAAPLTLGGQRWILLQMPNAYYEPYDCRGITMLLDYRERRFCFLWGWDAGRGGPARWPGWSIELLRGRTFVGIENGVAEMRSDARDNLGATMRTLFRSAHVDLWGPSRIDNVRVRVKRGVGPGYLAERPKIGLRMRRDARSWTAWTWKDLGRPGERDMTIDFGPQGIGDTWQMEVAVTDGVEVQFVKAQVQVERMKW